MYFFLMVSLCFIYSNTLLNVVSKSWNFKQYYMKENKFYHKLNCINKSYISLASHQCCVKLTFSETVIWDPAVSHIFFYAQCYLIIFILSYIPLLFEFTFSLAVFLFLEWSQHLVEANCIPAAYQDNFGETYQISWSTTVPTKNEKNNFKTHSTQ